MECSYCKEQFTLYLTDSLNHAERWAFETHLNGCNECRLEFEVTHKLWNLMGEVPEPLPSGTMLAGFNAILRNYKKEELSSHSLLDSWIEKFRELWLIRVQPNLAFGLVMIAIGVFFGYFLNRPGQLAGNYHRQVDSLSAQVLEMKQVMMLTLLQDPSASQRILAVGYTEEIESVNQKVIEALLTTLNEDPNVNVRLMTLEALVKYANEPKVREGLVQSITLQESPLLQSAIADVMVKLQEKKSLQSLKKLLQKKDLNDMVKIKIEQSIHKLI